MFYILSYFPGVGNALFGVTAGIILLSGPELQLGEVDENGKNGIGDLLVLHGLGLLVSYQGN